MTYASPQGHVLLDRDLYLPQEWTNDAARCKGAGIPAARPFATKPQLAQQMLTRAFDAGVPAAWVAGESVYGDHRSLRLWLEAHGHAHVLAVSGKAYVWRAGRQHQVKNVLATLGAEGWDRLSAGASAKGPRWYDWQWLPLAMPMQPHWRRWLLVRRSLGDPTERTVYVVFAPRQLSWRRWCRWLAADGRLNSALKRRRAMSGWITMKSGVGRASIGISRWPWGVCAVDGAQGRAPARGPRVKKKSQASTRSSLTAFKVARGLGCR